jgi:hypothetical protein
MPDGVPRSGGSRGTLAQPAGVAMDVVGRARAIVTSPQSEWAVIERESGETSYVLGSYVAILALIPAVCTFLGLLFFSAGFLFFAALFAAIVGYVMAFVGVLIVAFIVDLLAPSFGGRKDFGSALKLAASSFTPAWLVGVFNLIPALSFLTILGLYGIYLMYVGLPPLMKSPPDRSLLYTIAIIVASIVVAIVLGFILVALFGASMSPFMMR